MELWTELTQYTHPELLVLVPVLYFLGMILKKASFIQDRWIPLLLGAFGIALCTVYGVATVQLQTGRDVALLIFTSLTQGVLVSGASVFCNQIYKQFKCKTDDSEKK